ncbi:MAG: tetratricopeptide repeat protein [Planctomycetes bacterium]|nr:tetratricopeptide repeat protein [Planctomycetota bacterium]
MAHIIQMKRMMQNSRRYPLVLSLLLLTVGCSESNAPKVRQAVSKENVINETPTLTTAERADRFKFAFEKGMEWVEQRQFGLALGAFEEAVNVNPASVEALFNLGACHEQIGDPTEAIRIYRQVLRISPGDPQCYVNLGTSYIKMFHIERSPAWRQMAIDAWKHALKLDPDQPGVRNYIAKAELPE